jgi:hypothetical protein
MEESQVTVSTKTFDPVQYEINWDNVKTVADLKAILNSLEIMFTIPAEVAPPKQKLLHEKGILRVKQ